MMRHVVPCGEDGALLVVVCYRDADLRQDDEAADLLADLRREPFTEQRGSLEGLSEAEAATLLRRSPGTTSLRTSRGAASGAGGNPFFLTELLRSVMETDPLVSASGGRPDVDLERLGLPQSVRDVVARRVRRLSDAGRRRFGLRSGVGSEFGVSLVAHAADEKAGEVLELLDQAKDGDSSTSSPAGGSYSFSHDLIRQALYAELRPQKASAACPRRRGDESRRQGTEQSIGRGARGALHARCRGWAKRRRRSSTRPRQRGMRPAISRSRMPRPTSRGRSACSTTLRDDTAQRIELLIDLAEALVLVDETAGVNAALRAVDAARTNGTAGAVRTGGRRVRGAGVRGLVPPRTGRDAARRGAEGARRRPSVPPGSPHGARGVQVHRLPTPGAGRASAR